MYDIHVGDKFANKAEDKTVTVIEIDLDGRIRYEFASGAKRWADRDVFLTRFPIVVDS